MSATIGDLDDDGIIDLAVGATNFNGEAIGAVFILFMKTDGTVRSSVMIQSSEPAFEADSFGSSVCGLGDLDDDGIEDIGVGTQYDADGGYRAGAFWVLFMRKNGTVRGRQKINTLHGNFSGDLNENDGFGSGSVAIGDLDNDGNLEVATGARTPGVVYILFLNNNGTVKSFTTISSAQGLLIDPNGLVGYGLAGLGDVDGDGVPDIAIGGHRSDVNFFDSGVVFVVFLTPTGGVKGFTRISSGLANFNDPAARLLGVGIAGVGDYNADGIPDMVVGGDDTGAATGAIWYMMLNTNGTVKSFHKISSKSTDVDIELKVGDFFGSSLCYLGDLNNDGIGDVGVGAFQDDDGGADTGAMWISIPRCEITTTAGADVTVCSAQTVKMAATIPVGSSGVWTVLSGAGEFSSAVDPTANVTKLGVGVNRFVWSVSKKNCSAKDTVNIVTEAVVKPAAGQDIVVCEGTTSVTLSGNAPMNTTGRWVFIRGSGIINNPLLPVTVVVNPAVGINLLTWTFGGNTYCPAMADTILVVVQPTPVAALAMQQSTITCQSEFTITAEQPLTGTGTWEISKGSASILSASDAQTTITFTEKNKPVEVTWTVSVPDCPSARSTAVIFPISMTGDKIPNIITPNQDAKNDHWEIEHLDKLPNHVRVVNRWGKEVFSTSNYKNDWSGSDLAPGVYYYYLTVTECDVEIKGWLSIRY
jgi:gliding motility-associated-like protein